MEAQLRAYELHTKQEAERESIVVWNQKGLIVLWPDGHRGRFSWVALRQACLCAECTQPRGESTGVPRLSQAGLAALWKPRRGRYSEERSWREGKLGQYRRDATQSSNTQERYKHDHVSIAWSREHGSQSFYGKVTGSPSERPGACSATKPSGR